MNVKFKTVEFDKRLEKDLLSVVEICSKLRTKYIYEYLRDANYYFSNKLIRREILDDIYGSMIILAFIDGQEVGAFSCYRIEKKCLFIDKIEIINKYKGNGTAIFNELKKHFDYIKIEQAIPEAQPFYNKLGFSIATTYSCNKYPTMSWIKY